ncbi:MAG: hypothetical protein JSS62_06305 [Verrucomicrobia bacterium]|nr:hypothetical protein [Verrucomicrobiota bacterium]MBS0645343.1 hypothetical protein [Verrucomicrobiota bacterium]
MNNSPLPQKKRNHVSDGYAIPKHGCSLHPTPEEVGFTAQRINYNPKFFWMLAHSNGYKWLYIDYRSSLTSHHLPENIVDQIRPFQPDILQRNDHYQLSDSCLVVVLQKTIDQPFIPPIDAATGTHTHNKALKKRYPTVFGNHSKKNYFLKPFGLFRKFRSKKSASKN